MESLDGHLGVLSDAIAALSSSLDPTKVLATAMDQVIRLLTAERGFILLRENGELTIPVSRHIDPEAVLRGEEISMSLLHDVLSAGEPIFSVDAKIDSRFRFRDSVITSGLRSVICVPLRLQDRIMGVIYVDNRVRSGLFGDADQRLLQALAGHAAIAIENARLYQRLQDSVEERLALQERIHRDEMHRAVMEETNRLKEELVHYLVHDFKTPLMVILGGLKELEEQLGPGLGPEERQVLADVLDSALSLRDMAEQILDVYKIEQGKRELPEHLVGVNALAEEVVRRCRRLARGGVELFLAPAPEEIVVRGDRDMLRRVLTNLLSNALKYTAEGEVRLVVARAPEGVRISIRDSGPGISKDDQQRIFDKFARLGKEGGHRAHGAGLGLAFARLAIELHGGRIWVESEEGRGATFHVLLPTAPAEDQGETTERG